MHFIDYEPPKESRVKKIIYIVKSYLRIEACGYCGEEKDPEIICNRCMPKE